MPAGGGNCVMPCNGGSCAMPLDVVVGAGGAGGGGGGVMVCACEREPARGIDDEPPQRLCADASCAITTTATTMSARRRAIPSLYTQPRRTRTARRKVSLLEQVGHLSNTRSRARIVHVLIRARTADTADDLIADLDRDATAECEDIGHISLRKQ